MDLVAAEDSADEDTATENSARATRMERRIGDFMMRWMDERRDWKWGRRKREVREHVYIDKNVAASG